MEEVEGKVCEVCGLTHTHAAIRLLGLTQRQLWVELFADSPREPWCPCGDVGDEAVKDYAKHAWTSPGHHIDMQETADMETERLAALDANYRLCARCERQRRLEWFTPGSDLCAPCRDDRLNDVCTGPGQGGEVCSERVTRTGRCAGHEQQHKRTGRVWVIQRGREGEVEG